MAVLLQAIMFDSRIYKPEDCIQWLTWNQCKWIEVYEQQYSKQIYVISQLRPGERRFITKFVDGIYFIWRTRKKKKKGWPWR